MANPPRYVQDPATGDWVQAPDVDSMPAADLARLTSDTDKGMPKDYLEDQYGTGAYAVEKYRAYTPEQIDMLINRHLARKREGYYQGKRDGAKEAEHFENVIRTSGWQGRLDKALEKEGTDSSPGLQYIDPTGFQLETPEHLLLGDPEQVRADSQGLAAQNAALQQLAKWTGTDPTAADRAMYDASNMQNRAQADQMARGQREALAQQYAARGLGGSMSELAQQMSANQGQAQRYAMTDAQNRANMLGNIQNRALNAVQQQGSLGSQVRGDAYRENAFNADALNKFNQDNTGFRRKIYGENQNRSWNAYLNNNNTYNQGVMSIANMQGDNASQRANINLNEAGYQEGRRQEARYNSANRAAGIGGAVAGVGNLAGSASSGGSSYLGTDPNKPKQTGSGF